MRYNIPDDVFVINESTGIPYGMQPPMDPNMVPPIQPNVPDDVAPQQQIDPAIMAMMMGPQPPTGPMDPSAMAPMPRSC